MLADLGLKHPDAAKMLHVSLRTLQNWLSGRHQVPYAVYKLLRMMRYMELPGQSWQGWHFSRGMLVTPEGRTISGKDGSWWSLLVRQSRGFSSLYTELQAYKTAALTLGGPRLGGGAGDGAKGLDRSGVPVTRHFSPIFRTPDQIGGLSMSAPPLLRWSFNSANSAPKFGAMGGVQRP